MPAGNEIAEETAGDIRTIAVERNSFAFQPLALDIFAAVSERGRERAVAEHHAVTGHDYGRAVGMQQPPNLTRPARNAEGARYRPVCGHPSGRHLFYESEHFVCRHYTSSVKANAREPSRAFGNAYQKNRNITAPIYAAIPTRMYPQSCSHAQLVANVKSSTSIPTTMRSIPMIIANVLPWRTACTIVYIP